jgi:hypothetical protein
LPYPFSNTIEVVTDCDHLVNLTFSDPNIVY